MLASNHGSSSSRFFLLALFVFTEKCSLGEERTNLQNLVEELGLEHHCVMGLVLSLGRRLGFDFLLGEISCQVVELVLNVAYAWLRGNLLLSCCFCDFLSWLSLITGLRTGRYLSLLRRLRVWHISLS